MKLWGMGMGSMCLGMGIGGVKLLSMWCVYCNFVGFFILVLKLLLSVVFWYLFEDIVWLVIECGVDCVECCELDCVCFVGFED